MEQPTDTSGKSKWLGRLAWFFLVLFAIFWSLGAFFFWMLLGLAMTFGTYSLYYSGLKISLFDGKPNSQKSYQSYGSPTGGAIPQNQLAVKKALRLFFIIGGSIFLFLFVVGIFANDDQSPSAEPVEQETSVANENVTDDSPSTKGIELYNKGQYDSALIYYDRALDLNPNDADTHYNKALVYFSKQDYRKSIRLARNCLRINPNYNEGWWLVGDDYFYLNQFDSAAYSLERAYANNFRESGFLELMGNTYLKQGDSQKAKEFYLQVIQQDTTNIDVYTELAKLDPEKSQEYRDRATALKKSSR